MCANLIAELQGLPWYAQTKPGVKQAAKAYLVHEGLCERGFINFVVAMLAVAHNVHHHVALPLLAPLRCQLTSTHLQLMIITIIIIITTIIITTTTTMMSWVRAGQVLSLQSSLSCA